MYVCVCNAVTDREIVERVRAGIDTLEAIRYELGVATCCGQCADCAREVVDAALRERERERDRERAFANAREEASSASAVALHRPRVLIA